MKSCFHYNYDYWGYHGKKIIKTRRKRKDFFSLLSELSPVPGQFSGLRGSLKKIYYPPQNKDSIFLEDAVETKLYLDECILSSQLFTQTQNKVPTTIDKDLSSCWFL